MFVTLFKHFIFLHFIFVNKLPVRIRFTLFLFFALFLLQMLRFQQDDRKICLFFSQFWVADRRVDWCFLFVHKNLLFYEFMNEVLCKNMFYIIYIQHFINKTFYKNHFFLDLCLYKLLKKMFVIFINAFKLKVFPVKPAERAEWW